MNENNLVDPQMNLPLRLEPGYLFSKDESWLHIEYQFLNTYPASSLLWYYKSIPVQPHEIIIIILQGYEYFNNYILLQKLFVRMESRELYP